MRHRKNTVKLGRTAEHRKALLANQVCSLIQHSRIKTTLAKAKAVRPFAEKMLTLGKSGTLHDRRNAISYLHNTVMVKKLFEEVAPRSCRPQRRLHPHHQARAAHERQRPDGLHRMGGFRPGPWTISPPSRSARPPTRKPSREGGEIRDRHREGPRQGEVRRPPRNAPVTGSKRVASIAKRAESKTRKENASPTPQAKARSALQ